MNGRYKVRFPLENGPNASVFAADDLWSGSRKVLTLCRQSEEQLTREKAHRLFKGFDRRSSITHPFIVRVEGICWRGRHPGYISEHIDAPTLEVVSGKLTARQRRRYASQLAELLLYLHLRGVFVGYLSPGKVFLRADDVPILNAPVSNWILPPQPRSIRYLAPELNRSKCASAAGDIYSLGALFYLLFTGVPPYEETDRTALVDKQRLVSPTPLRKLNPEVPARTESIVMQMLKGNPRSRPSLPEISTVFASHSYPARIHSKLSSPPLNKRDLQLLRMVRRLARTSGKRKQPRWIVINCPPDKGASRLMNALEQWWCLRRKSMLKVSSREAIQTIGQHPANSAPHLILLEGIDHQEFEGLDFEAVLSGLPGQSVFVATTGDTPPSKSWTEFRESLKESDRLVELKVASLDTSDTKRFFQGILGNAIPDDFVQTAVETTGATPWLLEEFAEHSVRRQELSFRGCKWQYSPCLQVRDSDIPERVTETLKHRIGRLPRGLFKIASIISLLREPTDPEMISRISGYSAEELTASLNYIERAGIVRIEGGLITPQVRMENRWISALVQGEIDKSTGKDIHYRIAETLCRQSTDRQSEPIDATALAEHYLEARHTQRAEPHILPALDTLKEGAHYRKAHALLAKALSLKAVDRKDPRIQSEEILLLYQCGESQKCLAKLDRALKVGVPPEQEAFLLSIRARFSSLEGRNLAAVKDLEQALELLPCNRNLELELELLSELLGARSLLGQSDRARSLAAEILRERSSRYRHVTKEKAFHALFLFSTLCVRPFAKDSLRWELKSARTAERTGATVRLIGRLMNIGMSLQRAGFWTRAAKINQYCRRQAREIGNRKLELFAITVAATAMRQRGNHSNAIAWIDRYEAENEKLIQNLHVASEMSIERIRNQIALLDLESALNTLENPGRGQRTDSDVASSRIDMILVQASAMYSLGRMKACRELVEPLIEKGAAWGWGRACLLRARARLADGDFRGALEDTRLALERFSEMIPFYRAQCRLIQAEARLAQAGETRDAGPLIDDALRIASQHFFPAELAKAHILKSRWLLQHKQPRMARSHCRRALQLVREVERPLLISEIHRTLGNVENCAGNRGSAIHHYHQALELVSEKYFQLATSHRDSFSRAFLEPIERELADVTAGRPARSPKPLIRLREFTSALAAAEEPVDIGKQFLAKLSEEVPHTGANLFLLSESEQSSLLHSSGSCKRTGRRLLKQLPTVVPGAIITERLDGIASAGVPLWTGAIPMGMIYVERMKSEFTEFEVDYMGVMTLMAQLSVNHRRSQPPIPQAPVGDGIRLGKGERIVGEHPSWLFVLDQVRKVAPTRATVLITGESGTGKELIARAIHQLSNRADQRYFAVNCATVGEDLVENELFGHIKGSYTGASDSRGGMFEVTTNGTLLLDEISTMPLQIQAHLLRVLDTKTVRRIGGTREISVDTRVVAATNEDLKALVAAKRFRHDLYHRLNVVQINLPPLRERSSDIPMLCHYFLSILSRENGRSVRIRSDAVKLLEGYPFPGNVRELRNLLERLYHGTKAQEITADTINSRTGIQRVNPRRSSYQVDTRWDLMVSQGVSFDTAVKEPYLAREICTDDVIQIITRGLIATGGNYRKLTELFNIPPGGYRSFLRFLSTHGCKVDFRPFRKKETMK